MADGLAHCVEKVGDTQQYGIYRYIKNNNVSRLAICVSVLG